MLTIFRNRLFLAVTTGHFAVDVLNSTGPVLLAVLANPLRLTNAQIGLALTLYTFAGSLSQPLFGWLADRFHARSTTLAGLGTAWMALCYGAVALTHEWALLLPFFLLASLGWGDSAGLVEHLARVLDRPVDRIVQNDDGAYATRERLRQDMASGSDRLRGTRVVVLQFAARELATGDWKRIELPTTP